MCLKRIFIGCEHTYKPYGKLSDHYESDNHKFPYKRMQSQRCTKCGNIKMFRV